MPISIKLSDIEYPEQTPDTFIEFINLGKGTLKIEAWGYTFEFATLEDWEKRELARRYKNMDFITRGKLALVDFLTESIMVITVKNERHDFSKAEDKMVLRSILLKADEKPLQELYDVYLYLERGEAEKFRKKYGELKDKLSDDFFGSSGLSLKDSDSKTQGAKSSKK